MRVLVFGGTRFIGRSVVRHLVAAGHHVTVFNRGRTGADLPRTVGRIEGDFGKLEDYTGPLRLLAPDVVVHMMLLTGDQAAATASALAGITDRLVAISSGDVYRMYGRINGTEPGPPDPAPVDEDGPLRHLRYPYRAMADGPDDYRYDYDKIEVEEALHAHAGLVTSVVRLPMVYGPRDYQRRLWSYHRRMADGRPAILLDRRLEHWRASRCFVDDAGLAIRLAAESGSDGIYNVAEQPAPTEREWIGMIGAAAGWDGEVIAVDPALLPESQREDPHGQDLVMDSARIRRDLGFVETVSRHEAITRTVAWDRAHPPESHPDPFDYAAEDDILRALT
jgi:nucleoside-diphosphate-sugar epimerase